MAAKKTARPKDTFNDIAKKFEDRMVEVSAFDLINGFIDRGTGDINIYRELARVPDAGALVIHNADSLLPFEQHLPPILDAKREIIDAISEALVQFGRNRLTIVFNISVLGAEQLKKRSADIRKHGVFVSDLGAETSYHYHKSSKPKT